MTSIALIPRAKVCIYWNDIPSGIPDEDVLVLSFDDPERDRKSARFENSTGAMEADFLGRNSPEKVFSDYFETEHLKQIQPDFLFDVQRTWAEEFSKIEGFGLEPKRMGVHCSFCGKHNDYVALMIGVDGTATAICDGCVDICVSVVAEKRGGVA